MKEITFLKQNSAKWQQFEELLSQRSGSDPDMLADLFIQLTDDLSFSRTHYPRAKTTQYLNSLAARVHQHIYRNKKERAGRILDFWRYELPFAFRNAHRQLLYSFIIFMVAVLIGVISSKYDDTFARLILGDHYINTTIDNINRQDPMAIYKDMQQVQMFTMITVNNIMVSFVCFAFGVLFSLGTVYFLFTNGVMLGVFQYFFYSRGLFLTSFLVIWIHGTLEISAIVIAGSAGLGIGNSIMFPGTYSRASSFARGARQGIKIMVGLVPIFIVAGFLESFVTRHTEMPIYASLLIIGSSLCFILWYFIIYPIRLNNRSRASFNQTLSSLKNAA